MENIDTHVLSLCAAKLDIGSFLEFRQSFKGARSASEDPSLWACALCHSGCSEAALNFIAHSAKRIKALELKLQQETRGAGTARESRARFEQGLRYNDPHPYTHGRHAMRLAGMLPRLQVLVIDEQTSCLGGLTDGMAVAFSLHCPQLRRLEVRFAKGPVAGLPAERFTDDGLIAFAKGCPHLQVLSLCNCVAITDRSMYAVAANCQQLQASGRAMACHSNQNQTILYGYLNEQSPSVHVGMPHLKSLKLSRSATDRSLQGIAARSHSRHDVCLFPSLQDLDVCKCEGITAGGVEALLRANRCPELVRLALSSTVAQVLPDEVLKQGNVRIHLHKRPFKCKTKGAKTEVIIRRLW
ncbi:hypothetical protein DUNSADRAFT_15184 [Dunaliella salina]|uniref:Uncharacterized protein n=1 Tax=Dunaliella salina TaxID=3046 RepID=A0ABQ7G5W8_DUNSA|nr:hypothetical protein DUNSADRAFT_15184 [Dunaliella salina]|eukprot:KAF5830010.1 hypothetical protein DUNSADRAFT_15184 [Dunaliella salina]